jgi:hypothetical protein
LDLVRTCAATFNPYKNSSRLVLISFLIACLHPLQLLCQAAPPVQQCTITNIRGNPLAGNFCGGSLTSQSCTSGALYSCNNNTGTNNCKLIQACAGGCLRTQSSQGKVTTACYTGPKSLTVTPQTALGGDAIDVTAQVPAAHPNGVILNLATARGDLLNGIFCNAPNLPGGQTSETFQLATAVVGAPISVNLASDFSWTDASGAGFQLSSVPQTVTLNPGGTEFPAPPLDTFTATPSALAPGGIGFVNATVASIAPASGIQVKLTSSDPAVASIIANGQPFIPGGCTASTGTESVQIASSVPAPETVTITGATPQSSEITQFQVGAGCVKHGCTGGPSCGPQSDGCGGIIPNCGCFAPGFEGQVCGSNNQCTGSTAFAVNGLSFNPSTISSGRSSTATVTANQPAPAGGGVVAVFSDNPIVTVPSSVTIPAGASSVSFIATAGTLQSGTASSLIHAEDSGSATATLTVTPTVACTAQSCASQGKTCGTISDGCGGTLTCGTCSGAQTCGGGGVANVCGGSTSTSTLTVTAINSGDITTTPASSIKATPGQPGSAVFNTGTSITLQTSDGHGAIWSGACSSNGAVTGTCTFQITGAAAVTANNK